MIIAFVLGILTDLFFGNRLGSTSFILMIGWLVIKWLKQRVNFQREIKLNEPE